MKAPDKIYIGIQEDGFIDCGIQQTSTCPNEYIRKDALIEFVNKELQESVDRLDFRANQAYAEVFDKLNKM